MTMLGPVPSCRRGPSTGPPPSPRRGTSCGTPLRTDRATHKGLTSVRIGSVGYILGLSGGFPFAIFAVPMVGQLIWVLLVMPETKVCRSRRSAIV